MVAHRDNLKLCFVPISQGVTVSPVPESMDISFAKGDAPVEMNSGQDKQQYTCPGR